MENLEERLENLEMEIRELKQSIDDMERRSSKNVTATKNMGKRLDGAIAAIVNLSNEVDDVRECL